MNLHFEASSSPFVFDAGAGGLRSLLMVAISSPKPREPGAGLDLTADEADGSSSSNPAADNLLLAETELTCDEDPLILVVFVSGWTPPALL